LIVVTIIHFWALPFRARITPHELPSRVSSPHGSSSRRTSQKRRFCPTTPAVRATVTAVHRRPNDALTPVGRISIRATRTPRTAHAPARSHDAAKPNCAPPHMNIKPYNVTLPVTPTNHKPDNNHSPKSLESHDVLQCRFTRALTANHPGRRRAAERRSSARSSP